jgi:hypothetical protein
MSNNYNEKFSLYAFIFGYVCYNRIANGKVIRKKGVEQVALLQKLVSQLTTLSYCQVVTIVKKEHRCIAERGTERMNLQ